MRTPFTRKDSSILFLPFLACIMLVLSACEKKTDIAVTRTDSLTATVTPGSNSGSDSLGQVTQIGNAERPDGRIQTSTEVTAPGGGKQPEIVMNPPGSDPNMPPTLIPVTPPGQQPRLPVGSVPLLPAAVLAQFHPNHPDWQRRGRINNKEVPGAVHESITVLKNVHDSTRAIRSTVIDQDERTSHTLISQVSALRKTGSITQYPDGEAVTAYFVQIGNAVGSRAYIPSKKIATLTLIVGDHRLLQLREDKATSTDNLMDVARHIDLKKFEELR